MMTIKLPANLFVAGAACLLLSLAAACGDNSGALDTSGQVDAMMEGSLTGDAKIATIPRVTSTTPAASANDIAVNVSVGAMFSEEMDRATLTTSTFTVTRGTSSVPVLGSVIYAHSKVVFWPAAALASDSSFTATITTGARSASNIALARNVTWTFTTGTKVAPGVPVDLGTAESFVMLAKSGISTVPTSVITGNLGVSPIAAASITGFSLAADSTNVFSRSPQVTGKVYAANYASPTPANLTTAVGDMETAFTDAAGRAPAVTELGAGNIGGLTLLPGVFKWGTGVLIPANVTLSGSATSVWIFQIAQDLTVGSGARIFLAGGALSKNVFWQVSGKVTLGTTSHLEGILLTQTSIALDTGASINGRLLAQTAITIDGSTVVQPAP
jgi:hypothetical protein